MIGRRKFLSFFGIVPAVGIVGPEVLASPVEITPTSIATPKCTINLTVDHHVHIVTSKVGNVEQTVINIVNKAMKQGKLDSQFRFGRLQPRV